LNKSNLTLLFILLFSCSNIKLIPITAEGIKKQISSYKGEKAVLINVWALWCSPCIEEFPMIANLGNEIQDLEVLFISADFDEEVDDVVLFLDQHNIGPISYIKDQKDEPFILGIHQDWSGSLPFTIVYGKNTGKIIDYWEGADSENRFRIAIKEAISS
tara:strand:- start:104 stop:580 length:477 start_codon:yes stop_codon:yes gene_type:complete